MQADAKRAALQKEIDDAMADGVIDEDEQRAIDVKQAQVRRLYQKRYTHIKRDIHISKEIYTYQKRPLKETNI